MKFSELKKNESEVLTQSFQGKEFHIKTYLPIDKKYDLIMISLQESLEQNGIYNPIKLEKYYNLNFLYLYTDIEFTEEDKEDSDKIYDICETNDLFNLVYQRVPKSEHEILKLFMEETEKRLSKISTSAAGALSLLINSISFDDIKEKMDNIDFNKYAEVVNFADAIGANIPK